MRSARSRIAKIVAFVVFLLLLGLCVSKAGAQSVCPFIVSGGSTPRYAVDGLLLLRYASGLRDQNLTASLASPVVSHTNVVNAIAPLQSTRLDLDGDGFFTSVDAMVAARYMAGFAPSLWLMGLSLPTNATRRSGNDIKFFIDAGCPTPTAEAPRVLAVLPRADKVSVNAPIVVFFSKAMNKTSAQAAITTSPPVTCNWVWNDAVNAATCQPNTDLPSNTPYTINVATTARSVDNVPLAGAASGSFRTYNGDEIATQTYTYPLSPSPAFQDDGTFRIGCRFSHGSPNDPIVALGKSGVSHMHTFLGNIEVDAYTTPELVRTMGGSTCHGGTLNRSGYWLPAILDANGNFVRPKEGGALIYYKRDGLRPSTAMQPMPKGLRMIVGSSSATPSNPIDWYSGRGGFSGLSCQSAVDGSNVPPIGGTSPDEWLIMPHCPGGTYLHFTASFPRCWDGVNLDSPDHRSHVAGTVYDPTRVDPGFEPYQNLSCPDSHPVPLPGLSVNMDFPVPAGSTTIGWRYASDMYDLTNNRAGYSAHADFYNGWNEEIKATWVTKCLNERRHCADGELGDGRALSQPADGTGVVTFAALIGDALIDQLIASSMCGGGASRSPVVGAPPRLDQAPNPDPEPAPATPRPLIALFEPRRLFSQPMALRHAQWSSLVVTLPGSVA
jgi:Domain of unknown function (DUF1996)/Bacterial Ig-like domain